MTEQVEHQYHGRFLIELIQNAHDRLPGRASARNTSRIEFNLVDDSEFGTLYAANDGEPFSVSNFNSLSSLGQSDKDPQDSIGHKGIGFRSVLEISRSPEIFSKRTTASTSFDGFCFTFSPSVISQLHAPIMALIDGNDGSSLPFYSMPLVDWDDRLLSKLRSRVHDQASTSKLTVADWLRREMSFLSPYTLPLPTDRPKDYLTVESAAQHGFATIIRLPLKSNSAKILVQQALEEIHESDLLFLHKLERLVLGWTTSRKHFSRLSIPIPTSPNRGAEVLITRDGENHVEHFWVWQSDVSIPDANEDVQTAMSQLPGRWPEVTAATVSIAVSKSETDAPGVLSIFLPTPLETGCGAYVNAPFYGDMSRTSIDFGDSGSSSPAGIYNRFLIEHASQLAVSVIVDELAGGGGDQWRAILDLIAPRGVDVRAIQRWHGQIATNAESRGRELKSAKWMLSNRGWASLESTSMLKELESPRVLTPALLKKHAVFPYYLEVGERQNSLVRLSNHLDIAIHPSSEDLALTIQKIAQDLHANAASDWNAFWEDVAAFLDDDCTPLVGKRVLLGNDGRLYAASRSCAVFFIPRQGAIDDDEVSNESDVRQIPEALRPHVSFLSEKIHVYEERSGRLQQTRIRRWLQDAKLVSTFRSETILSDVLLSRVPELPRPLTSPDAALCRDMLDWGLRLVASLIERGKGDLLYKLLQRLPVPCRGGWCALGTATFGAGWDETQGDATEAYLNSVDTSETRIARDHLLLPPTDALWTDVARANVELLRRAGVFDGLRLYPVAKAWSGQFQRDSHPLLLPQQQPPGYSPEIWERYRQDVSLQVRTSYSSGLYEATNVPVLPGLDHFETFDEATRLAFLDAVIRSIGKWSAGWSETVVRRIRHNPDTLILPSPVAWRLRQIRWICTNSGDESDWRRPNECWHIPASELAGGRAWQFAHLSPLPSRLASLVDADPTLSAGMQKLGTPRFNLDEPTESPRLLEALCDSVERGDVRNWDVFLGQVRGAWHAFQPTANTGFPRRMLIHGTGAGLLNYLPTEERPAYLPDSNKTFISALRQFDLPVIAIEPDDAKRLANDMVRAYPSRIVRAATLRPIPIVDGETWNRRGTVRLQDDDRFDWLIPVLLTVAAFYGPQAQGTGKRAFKRHTEALRGASVVFAESLEIGLFDGERKVAPPLPTPANWHVETKSLLLASSCMTDLANTSEAFASLLDRDDLEIPLKLLLSRTGWRPAPSEVVHGLEQLKLSEAHLREAREHWRGDLSLVVENLLPLIGTLHPDVDTDPLVNAETDEAVIAFIEQLLDDRLVAAKLLDDARKAASMFEFGLSWFRDSGHGVQLAKWNAALMLRGMTPIINQNAKKEFNAHLSSISTALRATLAYLVRLNPEIGSFPALAEKLRSIECPSTFESAHWEVTFGAMAIQTLPLLTECRAAPELLEIVRSSKDAVDLSFRLSSRGVDAERDPAEIARENRDRLRELFARFHNIELAWKLANASTTFEDPARTIDQYEAWVGPTVESSKYLTVWQPTDLWRAVQSLAREQLPEQFWLQLQASHDIDDLIKRLDISPDALSNAEQELVLRREEARRRNRLIEIGGQLFDGSDENLPALWPHIHAAMPEIDSDTIAAVNLDQYVPLEAAIARGGGRGSSESDRPRGPIKRTTKAMENLIGLCGEIHAYRTLHKYYGPQSVGPACWISSNSVVVGLNDVAIVDDHRGCDFIISHGGRTYYIEVKSSQSDEGVFTLGSSESRLALSLARPRKRSKDVFLVLRVLNALSQKPYFLSLPNPYDPKYRNAFRIEEADMRVRYRVRPSDE